MSIYYKFKVAKEFSTIVLDAPFVHLAELKQRIGQQKKLGEKKDFDLQVTNAQTGEVYTGNVTIPKNTSVIIARVPVIKSTDVEVAASSAPLPAQHMPVKAEPSAPSSESTVAVEAPDEMNDGNEEDAAISGVVSAANEWPGAAPQGFSGGYGGGYGSGFGSNGRATNPRAPMPSKPLYSRGMPPVGYICHRCGVAGHYKEECTNEPVDPNSIKRIKTMHGVPHSKLQAVDSADAKTPGGTFATAQGGFATLKPDEEAFQRDTAAMKAPSSDEAAYICPLCHKLLEEAVLLPCCGATFCDKCIRPSDPDDPVQCPKCQKKMPQHKILKNEIARAAVAAKKTAASHSVHSSAISSALSSVPSRAPIQVNLKRETKSPGPSAVASPRVEEEPPVKLEPRSPSTSPRLEPRSPSRSPSPRSPQSRSASRGRSRSPNRGPPHPTFAGAPPFMFPPPFFGGQMMPPPFMMPNMGMRLPANFPPGLPNGCFKCGQPGHIARECSVDPAAVAQYQVYKQQVTAYMREFERSSRPSRSPSPRRRRRSPSPYRRSRRSHSRSPRRHSPSLRKRSRSPHRRSLSRRRRSPSPRRRSPSRRGRSRSPMRRRSRSKSPRRTRSSRRSRSPSRRSKEISGHDRSKEHTERKEERRNEKATVKENGEKDKEKSERRERKENEGSRSAEVEEKDEKSKREEKEVKKKEEKTSVRGFVSSAMKGGLKEKEKPKERRRDPKLEEELRLEQERLEAKRRKIEEDRQKRKERERERDRREKRGEGGDRDQHRGERRSGRSEERRHRGDDEKKNMRREDAEKNGTKGGSAKGDVQHRKRERSPEVQEERQVKRPRVSNEAEKLRTSQSAKPEREAVKKGVKQTRMDDEEKDDLRSSLRISVDDIDNVDAYHGKNGGKSDGYKRTVTLASTDLADLKSSRGRGAKKRKTHH